MATKAAVFLDRDGTISRDVPYCSHPDQFELLPGAAEAIKLLNENSFTVVVVTNQSGIARGYFTEDKLRQIHERMGELLRQHGAHVDAIYYCPHQPDDHCECRKPQPHMILLAASEMDIDLSRSYMIGDSEADIEAGTRAGCGTTVIIRENQSTAAEHASPSLPGAVRWVVDRERGGVRS